MMAEKIRVLYVDDEPFLLDVVKKFLEKSGDFIVTTSPGAPEAIRILGHERFDAIVSDYQMPGMDGIEFLKHLKAEGNTTPFIIITGKGCEEVVIGALNEGADFYIQKGGDPMSHFAEISHKIKKAVESRQVGIALVESEERWRSLFDSALDMIIIVRPDGSFLHVNTAWKKTLGYSDDDIRTLSVFDIFHPDSFAHCSSTFRELLRGAGATNIEAQFLTKDKKTISVEGNCNPSLKNGTVVSIRGIFHDVTERKWAEEALRESEELYRTLVESVNEAIILQDKTGEILTWNRAAKQLFGVTAMDVLGHTATSRKWKMIREDGTEFPDAEHPSMQTLATGEACKDVVMGITSDEGRFSWVNINTSPLFRKGDAKPQAVVISLLDITERKQAEEALLESEEKYRTLVDTLNEGIWVIDKEAVTTYVNPKMADILGYTVEEMTGRNLFSFMDDEGKRICEHLIERRKQGIKEQHVFEFLKKDGTRIYASVETTPIKDKEGEYLGAIAGVMDITDRKKTEDALRESDECYRSLFDRSLDCVYLYNFSGNFIDANQSALTLLGYTRDEIASLNFASLLMPDQISTAFNETQEILATGTQQNFVEYRVRRKDGGYIDIMTTASLIYRKGKPYAIQGIAHDITERKQIEEALRESEQKFRSLVEHALEGILILDLQGAVIFANNATARTLEVDDPAALIGRNVMEFIAPESREDVMRDFIEVSQGHDAYLAHYNAISAKGKKIYVESIGKVFSYEGKPADLVSIRDITERKQAEDALRESESFNRGLVENLPDYIAIYGSDGNLLYVNPAAATVLGYSAEKLVGTPVLSYVAEEYRDVVISKLAARHEGGEVLPYEIEVLTFDGLRRSVIVKGTQIQYRDTPATLLVLTDITERKRAEDMIKLALAEKEVLLREIHHRVKNNLAGIISLIDLQLGSVSDPVTITLLKDFETRIRSMALVHESLYRTEDLTHIRFTHYTEELTRHLFQVYGTETDIRCRIEMGDVTMPIETAIPCGLVTSEIVTNSLKYAFPRTFSCEDIRGEPCTIALTLNRDGSDYLLKIADNGVGISEGCEVTMSHSLGLFLIRFIVEHQLRGSLQISTAGGTAYTIRFPAPEVKERNNDE